MLGDGLALYAEHQTIDLKILHSIANPPLPEILEGLPEEIGRQPTLKEFLETLLILFKRQCDRFVMSSSKRKRKSTMLRLEINRFKKQQNF